MFILFLLLGAFGGFLTGLLGMVGAGGGFILIPLMIYLLCLPTKVTIGTSLGIVFLGSITATVGKIAACQAGAAASAKLPAALLRRLLFVVIALTCAQTWWRIIVG